MKSKSKPANPALKRGNSKSKQPESIPQKEEFMTVKWLLQQRKLIPEHFPESMVKEVKKSFDSQRITTYKVSCSLRKQAREEMLKEFGTLVWKYFADGQGGYKENPDYMGFVVAFKRLRGKK